MLSQPFCRGIELFNQQEFFESHEVLEDVWRPARGAERFFLQALIHFAVAFHHNEQGNPIGAELQLRKGLRKLAGYLPECEGVRTGPLYRDGQACLNRILRGEKITEYPKIMIKGATLP